MCCKLGTATLRLRLVLFHVPETRLPEWSKLVNHEYVFFFTGMISSKKECAANSACCAKVTTGSLPRTQSKAARVKQACKMFEQCKKVQLLNKFVWVLLGHQHHWKCWWNNFGQQSTTVFRLPNEGTVLVSGLIWNNSSYSSFSSLNKKFCSVQSLPMISIPQQNGRYGNHYLSVFLYQEFSWIRWVSDYLMCLELSLFDALLLFIVNQNFKFYIQIMYWWSLIQGVTLLWLLLRLISCTRSIQKFIILDGLYNHFGVV